MSAKVDATTDNGSSRRAAAPARQIVPVQISGPPGSERPPAGLFVAVATLAFVLLLAGGFVTVKALSSEWAPLGRILASPKPIECWNGNTYDDPADCRMPTGERGLKWVFPTSQAFTECHFVDEVGEGERESLQCQWADLNPDGQADKTWVTFSRWDSAAEARSYFTSNMPDPQMSETTDTLTWWSAIPQGAQTPGYSLAYREQPYSFFILGPDDNLEEAMKRLSPRPQSEVALHGVPVKAND